MLLVSRAVKPRILSKMRAIVRDEVAVSNTLPTPREALLTGFSKPKEGTASSR